MKQQVPDSPVIDNKTIEKGIGYLESRINALKKSIDTNVDDQETREAKTATGCTDKEEIIENCHKWIKMLKDYQSKYYNTDTVE